MNQVQRILKSNAPVQTVAGTRYKGQPPVYRNMSGPGQLPNYVKISSGVPFVRA